MSPDSGSPVLDLRAEPHFSAADRVFGSDLKSDEILTYLYLCRRAGKRGESWPTHDTIAADCAISVSSVKRALLSLRDRGWIGWSSGKDQGRANVFTLFPLPLTYPVGHTDRQVGQPDRPGVGQAERQKEDSELPRNTQEGRALETRPSPAIAAHAGPLLVATEATSTAEDFATALAGEPAYADLDVRGAVLRCEQWCRANRKALSKRRVVNWLNRDAADIVAPRRNTGGRDSPTPLTDARIMGTTKATRHNEQVLNNFVARMNGSPPTPTSGRAP